MGESSLRHYSDPVSWGRSVSFLLGFLCLCLLGPLSASGVECHVAILLPDPGFPIIPFLSTPCHLVCGYRRHSLVSVLLASRVGCSDMYIPVSSHSSASLSLAQVSGPAVSFLTAFCPRFNSGLLSVYFLETGPPIPCRRPQ